MISRSNMEKRPREGNIYHIIDSNDNNVPKRQKKGPQFVQARLPNECTEAGRAMAFGIGEATVTARHLDETLKRCSNVESCTADVLMTVLDLSIGNKKYDLAVRVLGSPSHLERFASVRDWLRMVSDMIARVEERRRPSDALVLRRAVMAAWDSLWGGVDPDKLLALPGVLDLSFAIDTLILVLGPAAASDPEAGRWLEVAWAKIVSWVEGYFSMSSNARSGSEARSRYRGVYRQFTDKVKQVHARDWRKTTNEFQVRAFRALAAVITSELKRLQGPENNRNDPRNNNNKPSTNNRSSTNNKWNNNNNINKNEQISLTAARRLEIQARKRLRTERLERIESEKKRLPRATRPKECRAAGQGIAKGMIQNHNQKPNSRNRESAASKLLRDIIRRRTIDDVETPALYHKRMKKILSAVLPCLTEAVTGIVFEVGSSDKGSERTQRVLGQALGSGLESFGAKEKMHITTDLIAYYDARGDPDLAMALRRSVMIAWDDHWGGGFDPAKISSEGKRTDDVLTLAINYLVLVLGNEVSPSPKATRWLESAWDKVTEWLAARLRSFGRSSFGLSDFYHQFLTCVADMKQRGLRLNRFQHQALVAAKKVFLDRVAKHNNHGQSQDLKRAHDLVRQASEILKDLKMD
jgi:hypothetical protein